MTIVNHLDSDDFRASMANVVFEYAPGVTRRISTDDNTEDAAGGEDVTGECAVDLVLAPGDTCTYEDFSITIRGDGAAVLDGNIGGVIMGNTVMNSGSINLDNQQPAISPLHNLEVAFFDRYACSSCGDW